MPLNNPVAVNVLPVTSSNVSRVTIAVPADITIPQILVAANVNRDGLTIWNDSSGNLLLELGAAPTPSTYTAKIAPGGYYELPYLYIGQVQGLWDAPGGNGVLVREFT